MDSKLFTKNLGHFFDNLVNKGHLGDELKANYEKDKEKFMRGLAYDLTINDIVALSQPIEMHNIDELDLNQCKTIEELLYLIEDVTDSLYSCYDDSEERDSIVVDFGTFVRC